MPSNDKKAKKPKHLGDFGFTYVTKVNGKRHEAEIGQGAINQSLRCDGCFKTGFLNRQGLGGHQATCKAYILLKSKHEASNSTDTIAKSVGSNIFTNPQTRTPRVTSARDERHAVMTL